MSAPHRIVAAVPWSPLAATILAASLWLLDVSGHSAPTWLLRGVVLLLAAALAAAAFRWARRDVSKTEGTAGVLLTLVLISLVVRFVGLGWEAGSGYYRDEGIYRNTARGINNGHLLPGSFIYGHLLFYLSAFALWVQQLFPELVAHGARALFGAESARQQLFVVLRSPNALMGALTTVPVYWIAHRIAGLRAAALAALLIVFSPFYNEITHLVISDVPSAFFATACLFFVSKLVDREQLGDYLWAGTAAGLAAGSKYPAGLVALAIAMVWLRWRLLERRWSWNLLWAGLASIGALLAVMPALVAYPAKAWAGEGRDLFFGVRQYAEGGWIGVIKENNLVYYGDQLVRSFRWPATLAGLTGLFLLRRRAAATLAWSLVFPIAFMALLWSMNMAVKRNLLPVVPIAAVVLGVGISGWWRLIRSNRSGTGSSLAWAGAAVLIAFPLVATVQQELAMTRPGTRQVAVEWIRENLPRGATLMKESYTPDFSPTEYRTRQARFAARRSPDQIRDPSNDYLLLAWNAYGRFTDPSNLTKPHHHVLADRYQEMLSWERVHEFRPSPTRRGPALSLFRIEPLLAQYRLERVFLPGEAAFRAGWPQTSEPRANSGKETLTFTSPGQWVLFKDFFEPGRYRASVGSATDAGGSATQAVGSAPGASAPQPAQRAAQKAAPKALRIASLDDRLIETASEGDQIVSFKIETRTKLFFYVELAQQSTLHSLTVELAE